MRHYVYFAQDSESGRLYIGSRSCKCDPLEDSYMGSYHDKSFSPDIKWVWAEFLTREDAFRAEEILHRLFDVVKSNSFVNRRIGSGAWSSGNLKWWTNGVDETLAEFAPVGWRLGRKFGTGKNIQNRGRPWQYKTGHSDQACLKMSKAHTGKKLSQEHKNSLSKLTSGRRWACNAEGHTIRLRPAETLPVGYQWGRTFKETAND